MLENPKCAYELTKEKFYDYLYDSPLMYAITY